MKKNYFLFLTLLISAASFGQNLIANGDFESWTGGVLDTWSSESGTTITEETTIINGGTSAANFEVTTQTQGDTDFRQTISVTAGTTYNVTVQVYQLDGASRARLYVDGYQGYSDQTILNSWQEVSYEFSAATTEDIEVGLRFYDISSEWAGSSTIIIDDYLVEATASCAVVLGSATYTCNAVTTGADSVTINLDYSGVDMNITSVTSTSAGTVGGDDPSSISDGTITLSGLSEGDSWDIVLNGGGCDGITLSGTVPATECYPSCFDLDATEALEGVVVTANNDNDEWNYSSGEYTMNGYVGGASENVDTWLVFGPLDMSSTSDLELIFEAAESFGDTDLAITYASSYSGCPASTTWTTAMTISDAGSITVDLSAMTGTEAYIGIQYSDDGVNGYSSWTLSDLLLSSDSGNCPTLGTVVASDCSTLSVANNSIEGFSIYPNPTSKGLITISSKSNESMSVQVYDIIGKQVINEVVSNKTLNVSSLNSGVYIVRASQNGGVTTKKLVVK